MKKFLAVCAAVCLISPASGQVITSPDGMWAGTIDPNFTGQLTGVALFGNDDLFESLFYEASIANGNSTWRVENNYGAVSQNIGASSATFRSMRNDGRIRLDTSVVMLNGPSGGALFRMTYTNVDPAGGTERLRPFFYADIDADPGPGGDTAQYLAASNAIEQFDVGALWWIGGAEVYTGWQIDTFSGLRTALDGGVSMLTNAGGGGAADWTGALSGALVSLGPGQSVSMTVGIGGAGIPSPASISLLGLGALILTRRRRRS